MRTIRATCLMTLCVAVYLLIGDVFASVTRSSSWTRYTFFRDIKTSAKEGMEKKGGIRRVFGGEPAQMNEFPGACALLDRYWWVRCSGSIVAPRWVLTAAHCVTPRLSYVKYNTRTASSPDGDLATVHYLYRHPKYKMIQEDAGHGMDVTLLHHDVGLVRTRSDMNLAAQTKENPLVAMHRYNPLDLTNQNVEVVGFGRTERSSQGEELFLIRLQVVMCDREGWLQVVCGVTPTVSPDRVGGGTRGVCAGDSGGPVYYRGAQIGVTSMGPIECATSSRPLEEGSTSVFTALHGYVDLIKDTISGTDAAIQMREVSGAGGTPRELSVFLAALTCAALNTF